MTPRQRWLAALRMQPVDRLPFWPKLNVPYASRQGAAWRTRTVDELHQWIGSDEHIGLPGCVSEVRSRTSVHEEQDTGVRHLAYRTPAGDLTAEWRWDEASQSSHPVVFPVKSVADLEPMRLFYDDCRFELDTDRLAGAVARERQIGQSAVVVAHHGTSPLMDWLQHLAGVENGHYLLADQREEVEGLFDAMHRAALRRLAILADHTPADAIYSVENTSTTLISPGLYERYSKRHVTDYGRIVEAAGKLHILHMCGTLKDLLPDLAEVPACAFEAFTTPPVGNTSLADGRSACPNTCLIGGTNAALWLKPAERIIAVVERDLDALPHTRGIVVTSAGVHPPPCPPERIKRVADWVRGYPVR